VILSSGRHLVFFDREGNAKRARGVPALDSKCSLRVRIPVSDEPVEVAAPVPESVGLRPGLQAELVVYASTGVALEAVIVVPLTDELPPPAPEPWK
jgi:hypothetical protein